MAGGAPGGGSALVLRSHRWLLGPCTWPLPWAQPAAPLLPLLASLGHLLIALWPRSLPHETATPLPPRPPSSSPDPCVPASPGMLETCQREQPFPRTPLLCVCVRVRVCTHFSPPPALAAAPLSFMLLRPTPGRPRPLLSLGEALLAPPPQQNQDPGFVSPAPPAGCHTRWTGRPAVTPCRQVPGQSDVRHSPPGPSPARPRARPAPRLPGARGHQWPLRPSTPGCASSTSDLLLTLCPSHLPPDSPPARQALCTGVPAT